MSKKRNRIKQTIMEESDRHLSDKETVQILHCRFCAEVKTQIELLDLPSDLETFGKYKHIIKFFKLDFIDLSQNCVLPLATCETCYDSFINAFEFFSKVKKAQTVLSEYYTVKQESKVVVKVEHEDVDYEIGDIPTVCVDVVINSHDDKDGILEGSSATFLEDNETNEESFFGGFDEQVQVSLPDASWTAYPWVCVHCDTTTPTMEDLRMHSKEAHSICFGFQCADCKEQFNTFSLFVEHVRQHRGELRLFCEYCNKAWKFARSCAAHARSHWNGVRRHCEMCGESLDDGAALDRHLKMYKQRTLPNKTKKTMPRKKPVRLRNKKLNPTSWADYKWACQECNQSCSSLDDLRQHAQALHHRCFSAKCMDCQKVLRTYRVFMEHATKHRSYLKKFCQYCNKNITDKNLMNKHVQEHLSKTPACEGCGDTFPSRDLLLQHMRKFDPPRKRGTVTVEDLTCNICQKTFANMSYLRKHRVVHDAKREREYTCDQCGSAFYAENNLLEHLKRHTMPSEICQICNKAFHTRHGLKQHVATHISARPCECNECGKSFRTKRRLIGHMRIHSDEKPFKCQLCDKDFKYLTNMRTHQYVHTGIRPFPCECCDKAFTNWANCNKHMVRKHGMTLAKSRITSVGRVAINRFTGEVNDVATDEGSKEWMKKLLERESRKKKPDLSLSEVQTDTQSSAEGEQEG